MGDNVEDLRKDESEDQNDALGPSFLELAAKLGGNLEGMSSNDKPDESGIQVQQPKADSCMETTTTELYFTVECLLVCLSTGFNHHLRNSGHFTGLSAAGSLTIFPPGYRQQFAKRPPLCLDAPKKVGGVLDAATNTAMVA